MRALKLVFILMAFVMPMQVEAASCKKALTQIYKHEGGFQNKRADRGNWTTGKIGKGINKGTKYGICAMVYPKLDIKNLTLEHAAKLYQKDYWNPLKLNDIKSQGLATTFFDTAVNMGPRGSIVIIEMTCNFLNGLGEDFPATGRMTPAMVKWINDYTKNKQSRDLFYLVFQGIRSKRYAEIATKPNQSANLAGWLIRTWS